MSASDYYARYQNCYAQISQARTTTAALDAKIERLHAARDAVATQRDAAAAANRAVYAHDPSSLWAGDTFTTFGEAKVAAAVKAMALKTAAKRCYDDITNEINKLENQKLDNQGLIGWLQQRMNDAYYWWQKTLDDMTD